MKAYVVHDPSDAETLIGVFNNKEDAEFVCKNNRGYFCDMEIKEVEIDKQQNEYYLITNYDNYVLDDNCFTSMEKAIEYISKNMDKYELIKIQANAIYAGWDDNFDDDGNLLEPDQPRAPKAGVAKRVGSNESVIQAKSEPESFFYYYDLLKKEPNHNINKIGLIKETVAENY